MAPARTTATLRAATRLLMVTTLLWGRALGQDGRADIYLTEGDKTIKEGLERSHRYMNQRPWRLVRQQTFFEDWCIKEEGRPICIFNYCEMRSELTRVTKTEAWPMVHMESRDHAGSGGVDIKIQHSTAVVSGTTSSWKAGFSGGVPNVAGVQIEGGTSTNKGFTKTKEFSRTYKCPSNHYCQVETLTWHVTLQGWCTRIGTNESMSYWCDGGLKMERCSISGVVWVSKDEPLASVRLSERISRPFSDEAFSHENMTAKPD